VEVKVADVEKVLKAMLAQRGGSLEQIPAEMKSQVYRQALDGLIVERLVTKEAEKIQVTDDDVAKEYDRFKGRFPSEEEMAKQLTEQGQTPDGIRIEIRKFLKQNRWLDDQLKGKLEVPDTEAEDFYKKNPEQFKTQEKVRASHILVKLESNAPEEEVKAKREQANQILDRVKKGEDFAKLATELSEDPSAKENKGDLDFFERERMVPEFSKAAFEMTKGAVSEAPVRSEFGFHIIKVTDRQDGGTMTFEEVKERLLNFLKQQKRQMETGKVLRALREAANVKVNLPEAN
jgi:peptidyl-prolyl cis-trans isomerase C